MEKIISTMILFFMLFSMTSFVFLPTGDNTKGNILSLSKSDIISVQYELCKQAKDIIINFSDIIIKDLQILYSFNHKIKTFLNTEFIYITNAVISINSNIEKYKINIIKIYKNIIFEIKLNILFVSFIFIFLIRYLGLLRLFNSPLYINLFIFKA